MILQAALQGEKGPKSFAWRYNTLETVFTGFFAMRLRGTEIEAERVEDYHVRVLDRVIAILSELANRSDGLRVVDLAEAVSLHKSTVHRLLAVLDKNGFVEKKPRCQKYTLGWRLFELGMAASLHLNLLDTAQPYVTNLALQTGETAHLGVLRDKSLVSLVSAESQYSIRTPATVGRHTPLHCVSQGKVILAYLPAKKVEEILTGYPLKAFTRNTITDKQRLLAELDLVRERGYAMDNEEFEDGLRCAAAAVRNQAGLPIAAIGIAGPTFRVGASALPKLIHQVTEAATGLSHLMRSVPADPVWSR